MFVLSISTAFTQSQDKSASLQQQVADLQAIVAKLQARVDELEKKSQANATAAAGVQETHANPASSNPQPQAQVTAPSTPTPSATGSVVPSGTTINFFLDGYYTYNANDPIGRVNQLRAYDVSSNSFSLNQTGVVLENAPDPDHGKRYGARLDLQFGQATQTLQGNPSNELRPSIYRNIFQAYGTYVFPVGKGWTVDFGKFASSLGDEGNYTKDQINYSRSYWFNFLPYYHMGFRTSYKVNDKLALNYWLVNGAQQTEDFNGFKDELFGFVFTPNRNVSWTGQYYFGQEHPNVIVYPNGGAPNGSPTIQGTPFEPIANAPEGKTHIFDTYLNWQINPKWTFDIEADDVVQRLYTNSFPQHTDGGAVYLKYQFTPRVFAGARAEYLSDRGGLFSGVTQALKDNTLTLAYRLDGFEVMGEWRRDFSNVPYFYTNTASLLKKDQNTATLGLLWWFGGKQGSW